MSSKRSANSDLSPVPYKVPVVENINTQPAAADKKSVNLSVLNKNNINDTQPMDVATQSTSNSDLSPIPTKGHSRESPLALISQKKLPNEKTNDMESGSAQNTVFQDSQDPYAYDDDDMVQFVSQTAVKPIFEIRGDRLTRQDLMRHRMYNETHFYLNNSNSKVAVVGITPTSFGISGIRGFSAEIKISGERCMPFSIGNINDFFQLMRVIRNSCWFKNTFEETKSMYGVSPKQEGFIFAREDSHGQPIYKISKIGTQLTIKLGYVSIEGLLRSELSIAKCYTMKNPSKYFQSYIAAMNAKIKNRMVNLYDETKFYPSSFIEETLSNFTSLFKYDLEQILGTRDVDLFSAEQ